MIEPGPELRRDLVDELHRLVHLRRHRTNDHLHGFSLELPRRLKPLSPAFEHREPRLEARRDSVRKEAFPLVLRHHLDLNEALRLQLKLRTIPSDVRTTIRYWLKSKARDLDVADALVYLRTGLEALFLDGGTRAELTFRLATHGAWYTGRNRVERQARYDVLKNVYGAASGVVHAGRVKGDGDRLLKDGQEICRQAILKRIRSKKKPVWREIVFGR